MKMKKKPSDHEKSRKTLRDHEVWANREDGTGHFSISKELLNIQKSTFTSKIWEEIIQSHSALVVIALDFDLFMYVQVLHGIWFNPRPLNCDRFES